MHNKKQAGTKERVHRESKGKFWENPIPSFFSVPVFLFSGFQIPFQSQNLHMNENRVQCTTRL